MGLHYTLQYEVNCTAVQCSAVILVRVVHAGAKKIQQVYKREIFLSLLCLFSLGFFLWLRFSQWKSTAINNVVNRVICSCSLWFNQTGFLSVFFPENVWRHYTEKGNRIGLQERGDREMGDIVSDISTSFVILIGIFFPSVTGTF